MYQYEYVYFYVNRYMSVFNSKKKKGRMVNIVVREVSVYVKDIDGDVKSDSACSSTSTTRIHATQPKHKESNRHAST